MKKENALAPIIKAMHMARRRKASGEVPPVTNEDRAQIEEFLKTKGVTKCEPRYQPKD